MDEQEILNTAKEIRKRRHKERAQKIASETREAGILDGKYAVIYGDPPWKYDNTGVDGAAAKEYETMSTGEICNLPIKRITTDNAVLFLWTTNPLLQDGLTVLRAWGFDYKTNITWVKDRSTVGFYVRGQHELLLIGVKGSMPPICGNVIPSVVYHERLKHSQKPSLFYRIIETMYEGPYIELFARKQREDWASWGNQT